MNFHVISISNAGHGAIFTNKSDAKVYQKAHPGSSLITLDHLPDRIPPKEDVSNGPDHKTALEITPERLRPDGPITVFTDGSALGNPGPGGYGIVMLTDGETTELSQGYHHTTNNRMEMMAAITALEELGETDRSIKIVSDSKYVIDGITKGWAKNWRTKGWRKGDGKPALNPDLWKRMLDVVAKFPGLKFQWVKGHAGDPMNERADELANGAAQKGGALEDVGYTG